MREIAIGAVTVLAVAIGALVLWRWSVNRDKANKAAVLIADAVACIKRSPAPRTVPVYVDKVSIEAETTEMGRRIRIDLSFTGEFTAYQERLRKALVRLFDAMDTKFLPESGDTAFNYYLYLAA